MATYFIIAAIVWVTVFALVCVPTRKPFTAAAIALLWGLFWPAFLVVSGIVLIVSKGDLSALLEV